MIENKKPYVIAIGNEKGGVGKTTTTLAIGTILARRGSRVLFIDLDPQGNLTLTLGYKPQQMPPPATDLPMAGTLFAKDSYTTNFENIDLVYARSLIVDEDHRLQVNTEDDAYFLAQDLGVISTFPYDYVLIDCPPSLGKITVNTLLVTDFLIVPTQADFFSTYAVKDMMTLIGKVRGAGNPRLLYRVLITRFDKRNRVHRNIKTQLGYTFGSGLFETIIDGDVDLIKTAILGFPTRSTRGVKQYRILVDELLEYIRKTQTV